MALLLLLMQPAPVLSFSGAGFFFAFPCPMPIIAPSKQERITPFGDGTIKLSSATQYGIKAALAMALEYGKEPLQAKTIAEREDISVKYIEQLISMLKKAGLARSIRGPRGGYVLAKSPSEISMKDVIGALEGPVVPVECHEHPESVSHCSDCILSHIWQELQGAVMGVLEKVTLAELVERSS